nr:hypothetical protein [Tanacetum cinerariifolium]
MDKGCWKRSYPVGEKNGFRCYSTLYSNGRDEEFWPVVTFGPCCLKGLTCFGVDAAKELKKNMQMFNAAGERLSAVKPR